DQRLRFALLPDLPLNEIRDLGVVHVEAHHLGGAPRRPPALRGTGSSIEDLEEAHEPARRAAARELLLLAADLAEVAAGSRAVLEVPRLRLHEVVDAHQVDIDGLNEARRALRAAVRVRRLDDVVALLVVGPVAAGSVDAVLVIEAAVEPDRRVESAVLVGHQERELGFEGVGVLLGGEVPAELLAGHADGVGDAMDDLADAGLSACLVAMETRLTEVLRDDDVRRELGPIGRYLGALHLEDDGPVRVRDDALPALPHDAGEGVRSGFREAALNREPLAGAA